MNWIKVATDIKNDGAIGAIADACGAPIYAAVGLVVSVFGVMASKATDGALQHIPDTTLEQWAGWDGKRGRFSAAFRANLCDGDGIVRSWEKYNGATLRELERTRERAKEWRQRQKSTASERRTNAVRTDDERREYAVKKEKEKEITTPSLQAEVEYPSPAAGAAPPPAEVLPWVAPRGHDALAAMFAHVPDQQAWVGILRGFASGLSMDMGRPCDPERLAVAVEDFVAKGKHREPNGPSPRLFRSFVKSARTPVRQYADQQTEAEYKAEQLLAIRRQNVRNRSIGQPQRPEPVWAAEIDAMFPDGRTMPAGVAA